MNGNLHSVIQIILVIPIITPNEKDIPHTQPFI